MRDDSESSSLIDFIKKIGVCHVSKFPFCTTICTKIKLTLSPDVSLNKELKQIATAFSQQTLPSKH
jgi:hypothetical protein